ncbi:MAG: hypothetical protein AAFX03_01755 [Pseudomonadota bacterium]
MTTSPQAERTARRIQIALALVFLVLGGWCLATPHMVERLVLRPEHQHLTAASAVWVGCFGAQAVLGGIVIATSRFTARTFLIFGLCASLPFFVFNYYFYFVAEMFTDWMLLDFVGNTIILACGLLGWRTLRAGAA